MEKLNYLSDAILKLEQGWQNLFTDKFTNKLYQIDKELSNLALQNIIYPPQEQIFSAFSHTKFEYISVVIIGQDPYHGENEANGLAFAVNRGIKLPPSLKNIFLELKNEYNTDTSGLNGELLIKWAKQGVLLLNSTLTVIKGKPNSLEYLGWAEITNQIIKHISSTKQNIVFILWGAFAKKKIEFIDRHKHLVLTSAHPSPLSAYRGFLGCNHFILANKYLSAHGKTIIQWFIHDKIGLN
ncbi:MAG: uracil-DNA glycosylase [Burkholderiales bacterium]|nr:uracil-DNA glycosylase [Burkholderiales bacterium]